MMTRITCTLAVLLGFAIVETCAGEQRKINIVVFMADDHGYADSSIYGSKQWRTPNMERIARDGAVFTHMFVASPSCAPSRAALLTGLMPARNGAEANHAAPNSTLTTLPAYLQRRGYLVAAFGKVAHYNMADRFGFDHVDASHQRDAVAKFLAARDKAKPLCLFVGTHKPHVPWPEIKDYVPEKLQPPPKAVDTPETRHYLAKYATAVSLMDHELGEIYDLVRERLPGDTLFIYVSDHGAQWPFGKWNLYDTGIRVPCIAVWPRHIEPGTRVDAMISTVDLLPTFVELAGGKSPKEIDGRSFANVLRGKAGVHRDEIYATHTNDGRFNVYPSRCLRTRDFAYILNLHSDWAHTTHIDLAQPRDGLGYWTSWKLAGRSDPRAAALVNKYHARPKEELYDLRADPWQQRNLASSAEHAQRLSELRDRLTAWMALQGDTGRVLVEPRPLAEPDTWQKPIKATPKKSKKNASAAS
jgi:uncharacterized sulfatase